LRILTLAFAILAASGCATRAVMPYSTQSVAAPRPDNVALLMTATIRNDHHPSSQPDLRVVYVEYPGAKEKSDRLNFMIDDDARSLLQATGNYLIRLELPPGKYVLRGFMGQVWSFPTIAICRAPLHSGLDFPKGGVYYIGHVDAVIRERKDGEFRAGPPLPFVEQAHAGFSSGTFDVSITDRADTDLPRFRNQFPGLASAEIQRAILPPFDREFAQRYWQGH